MTLSLSNSLVPGQTYTLAFQPQGLGNPFDNAQDWYDYAQGLPITVSNVNLNGTLFTDNSEIDVTFQYNGDGTDTGASIGAGIIQASTGPFGLYSYGLLGISGGASSPVNGGNPVLPPGLPSGGSLTVIAIAIAVAIIGIVLIEAHI